MKASARLEKVVLPHVWAAACVIVRHSAVLARPALREDVLSDEYVRVQADGTCVKDLVGNALDHCKEAVAAVVAVHEQYAASAGRR